MCVWVWVRVQCTCIHSGCRRMSIARQWNKNRRRASRNANRGRMRAKRSSNGKNQCATILLYAMASCTGIYLFRNIHRRLCSVYAHLNPFKMTFDGVGRALQRKSMVLHFDCSPLVYPFTLIVVNAHLQWCKILWVRE